MAYFYNLVCFFIVTIILIPSKLNAAVNRIIEDDNSNQEDTDDNRYAPLMRSNRFLGNYYYNPYYQMPITDYNANNGQSNMMPYLNANSARGNYHRPINNNNWNQAVPQPQPQPQPQYINNYPAPQPQSQPQTQPQPQSQPSQPQINNNVVSANSSPSLSGKSPSTCLDAFQAKALERTNAYRIKHQANPLGMSDSIATNTASSYAQQLNSEFTFQHNPKLGSLKLGENLYRKMSSIAFGQSISQCQGYAVEAIDSWYNEVTSYNFDSPGFSSSTGHFTQLVWKSTTNFGIGLAISNRPNPSNGFYYLTVVADYSPAGNYQGQYKNNVMRPIS